MRRKEEIEENNGRNEERLLKQEKRKITRKWELTKRNGRDGKQKRRKHCR